MARARENMGDRFRRSTETQPNGCIHWNSPLDRDGYGVLTVGRRQERAHRVAYQHFRGEIPPGMLVCHRCDNRRCVHPDHLFLGVARDNTQDMITKGRKAVMTDRQHPNTKIPHSERPRIRERRSGGERLSAIAADYGVCFQVISAICRGDRNYGAA